VENGGKNRAETVGGETRTERGGVGSKERRGLREGSFHHFFV